MPLDSSVGGMPERLRSALPADIADQVLREIATAQARRLPAGALEYLALELASKQTPVTDILRHVVERHHSFWLSREALRRAGRQLPSDGEVEAASATLRHGLGEAALTTLVATAPAGRSMTVPLSVVASLLERGAPCTDVIAAMQIWLNGGATDTELKDIAGPPTRPELTVIRTTPATRRPPGAGIPRRPSGR